MKKILAILLCLPALGHAMDAPLPKAQVYSEKATQELLRKFDDIFPFTFGKEQELKKLINDGANLNIQDNKEYTLLILALQCGYPDDFIKFLLEKGANPNIRNNDGDTALIFASTAESTQKLLEFNANPNTKNNNGISPINYAISSDWPQKISILLEWAADPNIADKDGDTTLMDAVLKESPEIVRLLLQAGANPIQQNKYEMSALDFAKIGLQQATTDAARATYSEIIEMLNNPQNIKRSGFKKIA